MTDEGRMCNAVTFVIRPSSQVTTSTFNACNTG
jgi:hypothetical protein